MHKVIKQSINLCVSLESSVAAETISYFTLGEGLIREALELQPFCGHVIRLISW